MRFISIVIALFVGVLSIFSQTRITGCVLTKDGRPAEGFVILSLPGEGAMLSFADLDEKGKYLLTFDAAADSLCVRVSGYTIGNTVKIVANKWLSRNSVGIH